MSLAGWRTQSRMQSDPGTACRARGSKMNLFGVMEVSGSALKAERIRAQVVAANMANAETTRTADGTPYRRQHVVFSAAQPESFSSMMGNQGTTQVAPMLSTELSAARSM